MSTRVLHRELARPIAVAMICLVLLGSQASEALAHGAASEQYRIVIDSVQPSGLPVDVRVADDKLRFENAGPSPLVLCGYGAATKCDPYVRIDSSGVFENRQSPAYFANLDEDAPGEVPEQLASKPEWKRIRSEPPFFAYHDHRAHWMGGDRLPPNVDETNPDPQLVNGFDVEFTYNGVPGVVTGRLEYVGGQTWIQRNGEGALTLAAIVAMLTAFLVDRRRRRASTRRTDDSPLLATSYSHDPASRVAARRNEVAAISDK